MNPKRTLKEDEAALLSQLPPALVDDFLKVRKSKKQPLTQTAIDAIHREVGKSGISLEAAIRFCCEAGWATFDSGWYAKRIGNSTNGQHSPADSDPDSLASITAMASEKGIAPWDGCSMQFSVWAVHVKAAPYPVNQKGRAA